MNNYVLAGAALGGSLMPGRAPLGGLSEPAAGSAPVTVSIRQDPGPGTAPVTVSPGSAPVTVSVQQDPGPVQPSSGPEGREQRKAEDKSPRGAEAVRGQRGGGPAAMKSEAQQRLQLNQFGDKNSACRPCLCSDFIKVSAALERKPACVPYLLPKLVGRAIIATAARAETLLSGVFSVFLCLFPPPLLAPVSKVPLLSPVPLNGIIKDRDREMSSSGAARDRDCRHSKWIQMAL